MLDYANLNNPALAIADAVWKNEASPTEVVGYYLERCKRFAKPLNAFLCLDERFVRDQVKACEQLIHQARQEKRKLPLAGVPIAIKDNIVTSGMPTTCGSKILENFTGNYDATAIVKLKNAGAIIFGKTNCDEFAMGSSNENSAYHPVKNPWDLERVPGGSSGGSAAAVAANLVPVALGSDTGGSIRQPASFCGVVGLKPTYGRVSRYGLVAYGSSLDQIGPITRGTLDAGLVFEAIAGFDERDGTSSEEIGDHFYMDKGNDLSLKGFKLGIIKQLRDAPSFSAELKSAYISALDVCRKLGAELIDVDLPHVHHSIAVYYVLATAEASANLARYDGIRFGFRARADDTAWQEFYQANRSRFGKEVKQRIMLGTFVLSSGYYDAYYGKANALRRLITQDYNTAFAKVDLLLSPTSPTSAFKLGEKTANPIDMYLADICTIPANLAGLPAISLPCGFDKAGLPFGLQITGPSRKETALLRVAHIFEQEAGWWKKLKPKHAGV